MSARLKMTPDHAASVAACFSELMAILQRDQREVGLCLWVEKTPMKWSVEAEFYPIKSEEEDAEASETEETEGEAATGCDPYDDEV